MNSRILKYRGYKIMVNFSIYSCTLKIIIAMLHNTSRYFNMTEFVHVMSTNNKYKLQYTQQNNVYPILTIPAAKIIFCMSVVLTM